MTVELRPFGVRCNIQCHYCYQNPQRDSGNILRGYDIEKMKAGIAEEGMPFALFGGEPLLMPHADLEDLWAWGLEQFGENSVQTNGVLIDDQHVRMFREYDVKVGISVDGPEALNDVRWAGSLDRTREATQKTHRAIDRLASEGLIPSLIVTLHRQNASSQHLPRLIDWFREMDELGISRVRLHILESENDLIRERHGLSNPENLEAYSALYAVQPEFQNLRFDVFDEMRELLRGRDDNAACVWQSCDPYTTKAVRGVEGSGQKSNCGRTNKDGIDFVKSAEQGFERYINLFHTPQSEGGCSGCRFFLMCKGQCPGTAIDGDWRNRTEHCSVWFGLYEQLEAELIALGETPLSIHEDRSLIEQVFLRTWAEGKTTNLKGVRSWLHENPAVRNLQNPTPDEYAARDFLRIAWVSDSAREVWAPRIRRIQSALKNIEWQSVASALRPCAVMIVSSSELEVLAPLWKAAGLTQEVLAQTGRPLHEVAFTGRHSDTEMQDHQVVIGHSENVARFTTALESGDSPTIARLLGTPECCHNFHHACWVERAADDPTWYWAGGTNDLLQPITLTSTSRADQLWRPLGLRSVPHQSCGPDCEPSAQSFESLRELGAQHDFGEELQWLDEILQWPAEWTALHGIAEIKTPILKAITRTDYTPTIRRIKMLGETRPEESPSALSFPWRPTVESSVSS